MVKTNQNEGPKLSKKQKRIRLGSGIALALIIDLIIVGNNYLIKVFTLATINNNIKKQFSV